MKNLTWKDSKISQREEAYSETYTFLNERFIVWMPATNSNKHVVLDTIANTSFTTTSKQQVLNYINETSSKPVIKSRKYKSFQWID